MKIKVLIAVILFSVIACRPSKSDNFQQKLQQNLASIAYKYDEYVNKLSDKDSAQSRMLLASMRYELQGLTYETEIYKINPNDSLQWVGAQFLGNTFYDISRFELDSLQMAKLSADTLQINTFNVAISKRINKAIDVYLSYLPAAETEARNFWLSQKKTTYK